MNNEMDNIDTTPNMLQRLFIVPWIMIFLSAAVFVEFAGARAVGAERQAQPVAVSTGDRELYIGNEFIERRIGIANNKARTTSILNKLSSISLPPVAEEFVITLMDGTKVPASEFDYVESARVEIEGGGGALVVSYRNKVRGIGAQAIYTLLPGDNYMRKQVLLKSGGGPPVTVDSLTVEDFAGLTETSRGGMGQPVYFQGCFFTGLEYPAGYNTVEKNGEVALTHYPGWELGPQSNSSKIAVIGATPLGSEKLYFEKYIETIRRKPRAMVVYNSWFDIRRVTMSDKAFIKVFKSFKRHLDPFGVKLDSLVIDDGWQGPDGIWKPDKMVFPRGLDKLEQTLRDGGSELGLWMPLCGYGLQLPHNPPAGFEASPDGRYFCLAGDNYRAALKDRLREIITGLHVNYFKHDFNFLYCTGKGPGRKPTDKQSFEANVDGEIDVLDYMHSLNPDVYLNVTSYMWLSPWWLPHADCLWIGSSDYDYSVNAPAASQRDRSITYYDEYLYRHFITDDEQFPLYPIMTHGIIDGVLNRLGGDKEDDLSWADNAMLYLGRGVLMRELYFTPDIISETRWSLIGGMLKWAETRNSTFLNGTMRGGDPSKGKLYWFQFDDGASDLLTLRNPSYGLQRADITLNHPENLVRVIYPYQMWLSLDTIKDKGKYSLDVHSHQVAVLETVPLEKLKRPAIIGVRSRIVRQTDTETEYELSGLEPIQLFSIKSGVKVNKVLINGKEASPIGDQQYPAEFKGENVMYTLPMDSGLWQVPATGTIHLQAGSIIDNKVIDSKLIILLHGDYAYMPSRIQYDRAPLDATYGGNGWSVFEIPAEYATSTHRIDFNADSLSASPFATDTFIVEAMFSGLVPCATSSVIIVHDSASMDDTVLPPPILQNIVRNISPLAHDQVYSVADMIKPRDFDRDVKGAIRSAKLRIKVFGSHSGGPPRNITVNGTPVATVPNNNFPYDYWQDFVIDINTPLGLKAIRKINKIAVSNIGGNPFKFTGVTLAVQLADGSWLKSETGGQVQYTGRGWQYAEGDIFETTSHAVKLSF